MTYTTSQFVELVKRRVFLPEQQLAVTDAEIITYANEEMKMTVQNFITILNENYGIQREIIELQDPVTGEDLYPSNIIPIPARAYCRAIREIKYRNVNTGYILNLPLFDATTYDQQLGSWQRAPYGVMIVGDGIQIVTRTDYVLKGSLEVWYVLEPSTITVPSTGSAWHATLSDMVYDKDTQLTTFTTDNVAAVTDMATYAPILPINTFKLYDLVQVSTGTVFVKDLLLTRLDNTHFVSLPDAIDEKTVTSITRWQGGGFPIGTPYTGDFILTPAGITDYIPLQEMLGRWLATLTSCRVCEALGDIESLAMVKALAEEERKTMTKIMGSRVPGECKRVVNRNGISSLIGTIPFLRR
jgi:hypothetical protein